MSSIHPSLSSEAHLPLRRPNPRPQEPLPRRRCRKWLIQGPSRRRSAIRKLQESKLREEASEDNNRASPNVISRMSKGLIRKDYVKHLAMHFAVVPMMRMTEIKSQADWNLRLFAACDIVTAVAFTRCGRGRPCFSIRHFLRTIDY